MKTNLRVPIRGLDGSGVIKDIEVWPKKKMLTAPIGLNEGEIFQVIDEETNEIVTLETQVLKEGATFDNTSICPKECYFADKCKLNKEVAKEIRKSDQGNTLLGAKSKYRLALLSRIQRVVFGHNVIPCAKYACWGGMYTGRFGNRTVTGRNGGRMAAHGRSFIYVEKEREEM